MTAKYHSQFRTRSMAIRDFDTRQSPLVFLESSGTDLDRSGLIQTELTELIWQQAGVGIVVYDAAGEVTWANVAALKLGLNPADPTTWALDAWGEILDSNGCHIPPEQSPCMKAMRGETTSGQECRLLRSGSGFCDILFSAAPIIRNQQVVGAIATLTDITQRKREELKLREDAVFKERSRMATDLHDTICQSLNAISLLLEAAEDEFSAETAKARRHLRRAHEIARESLAEARRSMWTLSHESLEREDLAPALSFIARQLFAGTLVKVELSLQPETCSLSSELRRELLRIGREALANVLKHAQATKVHLGLAYQNSEVQLCVFDNGHGFASASIRRVGGGGWGLNNMRKRAERMGGKLVVHSLPGKGTRVMATLPLHAASMCV
jgi:signal transduction histidine kinase